MTQRRTPNGFVPSSSPVLYQQAAAADSPVDLSTERDSIIIQADSTAGQVDIAFPSAVNYRGKIVVQHPSIANPVVVTAVAGETFDNNLGTNTPAAVGVSTYYPVKYAGGGAGWAVA